MKKKVIVFVFLDFIMEGYIDMLKIVLGKYDVIGIRVYDEKEENILNLGMV